jgi:Protein of unknown function (DUF3800)
MVEAYMDESGIHEDAHVCVVAGYWGSVKKWRKFEKRWSQLLKDEHLIEFHSAEFWRADGTRKGKFAEWSDTKANRFIYDLAMCIVDAAVYPTSAILVTDAWNKLNREERMFLTGARFNKAISDWISIGAPNRQYFLPFRFGIEYPAIQCKPGLHVHYIFDLNKQFKHYALELFHLIKNDPRVPSRHQMGALDFQTSDVALGLQAADLLAYQAYKFGKIRAESDRPMKKSEMPPLLGKLITNMRTTHDFPFLNEEGLNVVLHNMPTHLRSPGWTPVLAPH